MQESLLLWFSIKTTSPLYQMAYVTLITEDQALFSTYDTWAQLAMMNAPKHKIMQHGALDQKIAIGVYGYVILYPAVWFILYFLPIKIN